MASSSSPKPQEASLDGARLGYLSHPDHPEPVQLDVQGAFPSWLSGTLWRIGPGTYEIPTKDGKGYKVDHWFDGHGMLHAFQLDGASNSVQYRSRSTTQELNENIHRDNGYHSIRFHRSTDPCKNLFARFFTGFRNITSATRPRLDGSGTSNCNVSVTIDPTFAAIGTLGIPSQGGAPGLPLVARTDANAMAAFDPETLEPLRTFDYTSLRPELKGVLCAAHGVNIEGTFYNYVLDFGRTPTYRVFSLAPAHAADPSSSSTKPACEVLATLTDVPCTYLHSIAGTEHFLILTMWECDFALNGLGILSAKCVTGGFKPWAGRKTKHIVIDRKHGRGVISRFVSPPMFVFHHINAFERPAKDATDGSVEVVLDLASWDHNDIVTAFEIEGLREGDYTRVLERRNHPARIVLPGVPTSPASPDPSAPKYRPTNFFAAGHEGSGDDAELNIELPVVNPQHAWVQPSRFGFGIHRKRGTTNVLADSIVKLDMDALEAGAGVDAIKAGLWDDGGQRGLVPGEPIFIPTPAEHGGTGAEDDGVLLVVALDSHARTSRLYAVDARTMQTIARADVGRVVPYGFHGAYKASRL